MTAKTPSAAERSPRRLGIAVALLGLTLAVGLALRAGARIEPPPTGPTDLHYTAPGSGPVHLSGRLDRGSVLGGGDGLVKLELVLRADERPSIDAVRTPSDLVVVLDRSGSMDGAAMRHAKAAVRELVSQLEARDRFALVSYASDARLDIALAHADTDARRGFAARLAAIASQGGTNMARGLDLAHQSLQPQPGRAIRVLLLSDGHANEGDHSHAGLLRRAGRAIAGEYVLSSVGVGDGFDEILMTRLADAGTGNFYYVDRAEQLAGVFTGEFGAARETLARALQLDLAPGAGVQVIDAAGYPLERSEGRVSFRPGDLFAGQERRIFVTLRVPVGSEGEVPLGDVSLIFRDVEGATSTLRLAGDPSVAVVRDEEVFVASIDSDQWAESVVVDDYNALKEKVAGYIQQGRPEAAREELDRYRDGVVELNRQVKNARVNELVADQLGAMGLEIEEAEVASPQKQNQLSKKLRAEARDGRRVGAKR
ncbi:MAG: VWA domain-containing protein [Proteobacteria bacterium]|nr:VWA domain-containing protein [Pseudomonadota bacterium]